MSDPTVYLTPICTLIYPSLFEPSSYDKEEPTYSGTFLIPKTNDLAPMREAVKAAATEKWGQQILENLKSLHFPLRDGNNKAIAKDGSPDKESFYYNQHFIRAKSAWQPAVVNIYNEPITDPNEIYGGCLVRAYLKFAGWTYMGKQGISGYLQALCKVEDGEPIGGNRVNTAEAFRGVIKEKQEIDFNSKEYNETGQQNQEWGDNTPPPMGEEDDIPF